VLAGCNLNGLALGRLDIMRIEFFLLKGAAKLPPYLEIHSGRYTAAPNQDTQWWIHSRSLGDLPGIVTSPPSSTFQILEAAKPQPVLVYYVCSNQYTNFVCS